MANRQWDGRDGRDLDERDLQERSNYYGQGGWRGGDERQPRDLGRGDERWMGRDQERSMGRAHDRGDERWMGRDDDRPMGRSDERWMGQGYDRGDERWMGRGPVRDERWRRDMGRDFSRHEWSPYDRDRDRDEDRGNPRDSGFGFGGTDRGFRGGGYGGYGGGDYRDRSMSRREGGFFGPGSGMFDRDMPQRPAGRAPRGYQRSDERIKEDLCDRLMHSWIDAENVDIEVKSGEVTLSGTVEDRHAKRAIEDMAEEILGVRDVQNRIRVGQPHATATTTPGTPATQRKPSA